MSRQLLNDHPWSEDECEYARGLNRHKDIEQNKKDFPPGAVNPDVSVDDSPVLKLDPDIFESVNNMDLESLKSEHKKRGLVPAGDEKALKVSLAQLLQSERDNAKNQA